MKKSEILKQYRVDKLGDTTVFISNRYFNFSYTIADSIIKEEFKNTYRYVGGLQCDYIEGSPDYNQLENWLCEIAEKILNKRNNS